MKRSDYIFLKKNIKNLSVQLLNLDKSESEHNLIIIILNTFNFNKYCVITGSRLYININLKQDKSETNGSARGDEVKP